MGIWIGGRSGLQASNSDSLDVVSYAIHVDSLSSTAQYLGGHTQIRFTPKLNGLNQFSFDLFALVVDSAQVNGVAATWSYNDTLLVLHSATGYNTNDTVTAEIWYHGQPRRDPSGFGGFYFANNFIYSLGVGLDIIPHNFGRCWFPCKDNFTDRALFDFHIRADSGKIAVCNGTLQSETPHPNGGNIFHWTLHNTVPTYLVGMAISDYIALRDTYPSISGDSIPVALYFRQVDSTRMANLFSTLSQGIRAFEDRFGPYQWERVGYVGVPFNGGAMEHATSVAFPINALLATEDIMAHELSHSWFGNLVTCENAGEMWLNEGWASYCEAVYFEALQDSNAYKNYVRANHSDVLRRAHINDGGYFAVSGIDESHTYGSTVYSKGASIVHNLRKYMGDSLFFPAVKQYLADYAFRHANSDSLRMALEAHSGKSLGDWFDAWVYQPGFLHYSIDSFSVQPNGTNFDVTVHVRQRLKAALNLGSSNELEITFMDNAWNPTTRKMTFSGGTSSQTFSLSFQPVLVMQDFWEKIMDAETDGYHIYSAAGSYDFPTCYFSANAITVSGDGFVRVTHNMIAPDPFQNAIPGVDLSDSRYWTVETDFPTGFHANATFSYNGTSSATGYLDNSWLTNREDSLILFYRKGAGHEWQEANGYTLVIGSPNDKRGTIVLDTLKAGEYTLGQYQNFVGVEEPDMAPAFELQVVPNPTGGRVMLSSSENLEIVRIFGLDGKEIAYKPMEGNPTATELELGWLPAGIYWLEVTTLKGKTRTEKVVIQH